MNWFLIFLQVERQVVDQIIDALHRKLISRGCSLHLTVDLPKGPGRKSLGDAAPPIKLQLIKEGKKKLTSMLETREVQWMKSDLI